MSSLASVLSGDEPTGVYRTSVTSQRVRDACDAAGWRLAVVDGVAAPGRRGLLREVGRALDFPDWYGENFDALADCLADVTTPSVLLWEGWGALALDDPQSYVVAGDVLCARAADPPAFVVLLGGDGPDVDPPWLGA